MFDNDRIAGCWTELTSRLDGSGALVRWADAEPALAGVARSAQLAELTAAGSNPARVDEVLGGLIRLAVSGERDAILLLLHLLSPGVQAIAAEVKDLTTDPVAVVAGELAIGILTFGPGLRGGQRRRAFAANLLLDTRRRVLRELRPHCTAKRRRDADVLVDPVNSRWMREVFDSEIPGPGDDAEPDLDDVLRWAVSSGVARPDDLAVLLEAERSRDRSASNERQREVAAALGVHPSTLRRRRGRALAALRSASCDYFDRWLAA